MVSLVSLGKLAALDEVAADMTRRARARGFLDAGRFARCCENILVDHPAGKALVLPAGTSVPGDLVLDYDWDEIVRHGITAVAVPGDLEITGRLINRNCDGGVFLLVDGQLRAREIIKGGASIAVMGGLGAEGVVFCDNSHGVLLVGGDLSARALISNDQDVYVEGRISALEVSDELSNMRELLVPEVFEDPDDPEDEFLDAGLVIARLEAGLPVLKSG